MAEVQEKREKWKKEQARLRGLLRTVEPRGFIEGLKYVGGVDISFVKNSDRALACLTVLEYPSLKEVETFYYPCIMSEPYMPGFLAFREVDHLKECINKFLVKYPAAKDHFLIMVDGNGILHYRGFGSASHLGVVMGIPTIGVGKELLVVDGMDADHIAERCKMELKKFGDQVELVGPRTGKLYGKAVRSKSQYEPIYVSIGHLISLETAVDLVLKCCRNNSLLPEPVRLADGLSRDVIIKNPGLTNFFDKKPTPSSSSSSSSSKPSSSSFSSSSSKHSSSSSSAKSSWGGYERDERAIKPELERRGATEKATAPAEKGDAHAEKGRGKRGAHWACDCGANNSMQRDVCEFCYHSRKVEPAESASAASPAELGSHASIKGNTQRRKTSWTCVCGWEVVDSASCGQCRHINM